MKKLIETSLLLTLVLGCSAIPNTKGMTNQEIGSYITQQEQRLREGLKGSGVKVLKQGEKVTLIMSSNTVFAMSSTKIKQSFYSQMDSIVAVLEGFNQTEIKVIGHSDSVGSLEAKQLRSDAYANSVVKYLSQKGIQESRIEVQGKSDSSPVASNISAIGRSQNRRVEIIISPY